MVRLVILWNQTIQEEQMKPENQKTGKKSKTWRGWKNKVEERNETRGIKQTCSNLKSKEKTWKGQHGKWGKPLRWYRWENSKTWQLSATSNSSWKARAVVIGALLKPPKSVLYSSLHTLSCNILFLVWFVKGKK